MGVDVVFAANVLLDQVVLALVAEDYMYLKEDCSLLVYFRRIEYGFKHYISFGQFEEIQR